MLIIPALGITQPAGDVFQRPTFLVTLEKNAGMFFKAAWLTIKLSVLSMMLASALGLGLALMRVYGNAVVSRLALLYVEFVRGTPLLIQLYFIYYGLPQLPYVGKYCIMQAEYAAIIGMGINYAAYEAEIYRTGIMAIPRSQTEAAAALGLTKWQTIRLVILPQALRLVVPPVTNDFVALFKDTSIVNFIGVTELTGQSKMVSNSTQYYLEYAIVTALAYFAISYPVSKLARALERKIHPHHDQHP